MRPYEINKIAPPHDIKKVCSKSNKQKAPSCKVYPPIAIWSEKI